LNGVLILQSNIKSYSRKYTKKNENTNKFKKIFDMTLQTEYQKKRAKRRADVYAEYRRLVANEDNSRSAIIKYLMGKYNIGAASTIYGIIKEKEGSSDEGKN